MSSLIEQSLSCNCSVYIKELNIYLTYISEKRYGSFSNPVSTLITTKTTYNILCVVTYVPILVCISGDQVCIKDVI